MDNIESLKNLLNAGLSQEVMFNVLKEQSNIIKTFVSAIIYGEEKEFRSAAKDMGEDYLLFINKFYSKEFHSILLFPELYLLDLMLSKNEYSHFIDDVYTRIELSAVDRIDFLKTKNGSSKIEGFYSVKNEELSFEDSLSKYSILLKNIAVSKEDDDFQLMASVMDIVPVELSIQNNNIIAIPLNKKKEEVETNAQSLLNKLRSAVLSAATSPVTKYAGIALVVGLALTGTDAFAGVNDAVEAVGAVNSKLAALSADLPDGCEIGAKVIKQNSLGMTFDIQVGDYLVRTEMLSDGSGTDAIDQSLMKSKTAKGCGFSKEQVMQLANTAKKSISELMKK